MKSIFLVNGLSKTSIPARWAEYFNRHSSQKIKLLSIKQLISTLLTIEKEVDVIHGHHIKAMAIFILSNFFLNKNTVYTVHGSYLFLSKINALLLQFIFKFSDKVIFVNQMLYDVLPESYKHTLSGKYEIILNGVEIAYNYNKSDVFSKFNIDTSDILCFHPARFVPEKNHLRLITAFKPLIDNNPKIKLILAGDGKLKSVIQEHVNSLNLEQNVIFPGLIERDEVYCFLERCNLFVMPSISEGLNIAFLEAISMKIKIVVSDIEQFTYPLKAYNLSAEKLNITFVDQLDEGAICKGINNALEKERNITFDCSDFSLSRMMEKYENIYNRLIEKKAGAF